MLGTKAGRGTVRCFAYVHEAGLGLAESAVQKLHANVARHDSI